MSYSPNDSTLLFRPAAAMNFAAVAAPPVAPVDTRQIAGLAAINPVVAAANPLLMMVPALRTAHPPGDVGVTRARLIEMVRDFDAAVIKQGLPDDQRNIARYALCTVVDEAIQMTPWGTAANWAQQSLLIHFFKENWGGEKFFQILDKMSETPSRFTQVLELFYVCLAVGFMGRFHLAGAQGRQAVGDLRERLYVLIKRTQGEADRTLSGHWKGVEVEQRRFKGFAMFGVVAALCVLASLGVFAFYSYSLAGQVDELALSGLALKKGELTKVAMAPAPKPRLAQLLAPEIQGNQVSVKDLKLESVVTLLGEGVFESGSAAPTARSIQLLRAVAAALDQVEGQVVVTGHTDNVPTRTLRYASNFALSKDRAANVKAMIDTMLKDPGRSSAEGKGDTEPVASNDTAEGRAQNRRVEITLRVPSTLQ
ncbi:type VI secretion system protein TssL, long form [Ramlibacter sp. XY19]|uniref:type VI secretion system protein TssL, long form n=1 Tax=Ramlibacter paludis TaxID=2908000 RepID=UPI0023DCBD11|nr:type VI secretion system protein TssL, long form [Ramlibacter paludis]MCG2595116.1 type VI secretion system protein TssL, long form [Ramlibacter paludis]